MRTGLERGTPDDRVNATLDRGLALEDHEDVVGDGLEGLEERRVVRLAVELLQLADGLCCVRSMTGEP